MIACGGSLVHTAPGHGHDDFEVCKEHGLPVLCPVDDEGRFTADAGESLQGMYVLEEGNKAVLAALRDCSALLHSEKYLHRYPYDWRSKKPVIIRTTKQWFARVDVRVFALQLLYTSLTCEQSLVDTARAAISHVRMVPESSKNRLNAAVGGRNEWCISRQRSWGVPIPVFYDSETYVCTHKHVCVWCSFN